VQKTLQISFALPVRRWFLTNNFIYIMHFTIGVCCVVAMWATLCLFAARLWRALGSGKRWSPRRRAMCTYTAALVAMQVQQPLSTGGQTSLGSRAWVSRQAACAARPHAVPDGGLGARSHPVRTRASQHLSTAWQAVNTLCYVAANTIILFGHCLWYAPSVLWLGFIRWEVRPSRVMLNWLMSECCTCKRALVYAPVSNVDVPSAVPGRHIRLVLD